ncbi:Lipase chaperone [Pseudomonas sp. 8Z]|uniref:lipase secretion chaperone n=1 Tax=Pseudomonas sp. 8Z TaxID=2653166 RepID=UPI0012F006BB|nr:lipase secretion chaperone [Pseudomonas sp. 8Z]VXC63609.1 Lipase chaperone [Pseudomonas sp. 8Z]
MNRLLLLIPGFFAVSLALMLYLQPPIAIEHTAVQTDARVAQGQHAVQTTAEPEPERTPEKRNGQPLPASFVGTEIDGGLHVDATGQLLIDEGIRRLFDYFLASIGEDSLRASVKRLRSYIDGQLHEPARAHAQRLLDQYLDYKRELVLLERDLPQLSSLDALRQREAAVQALRARLFDSQTHQAFFAQEEGYNRFTLQRLAIAQNAQLSDVAKGQAIDRLRANLPPDLQDVVLPQLQQELRQHTLQLQANGASATQIRQMRQQLVGAEATMRLEALDDQRQRWQQRLDDYLAAKALIQNNRGLSANDRQAALDALASQRFDAHERLRLEAAEQLAASRKKG